MVFAVPHDTVLISDGGLATELGGPRPRFVGRPVVGPAARRCTAGDCRPCTARSSAPERSIATTASYQASFDGFAARGIGRDDAARLLRRSVELAKAARDEVERPGGPPASRGGRWVAASVGPYGAALANGEEYVGRYGLSVAQLADWHRPRLEVLADAGADVLALETVPDVDEAEALVGARSRVRCAGVAVLHDRRDDDPRRAAAGRRVRGRRRRAGNRCGGGELLRARRRRACDPGGPRRHGQASSSTPTAAKTGTASAERGSDSQAGRPNSRRDGRRRAHASSAGVAGYGPTTSPPSHATSP